METTTLFAPDIVCQGCANAIKKTLGAIVGVSTVEVNINAKSVRVAYDASVTHKDIIEKLGVLGFPTTEV